MYSSTITKKGQIVIPKPLRDALKIPPGKRVSVTPRMEKGKVIAVVVEPIPDIMELAGKFKPKRRAIDPVKIREYMETHYARV